MTMENPGPVGCLGRVTVATRGLEGPGEVMLQFKGGTEAFMAWSDTPLALGTAVIVFGTRGGRVVDVVEFNSPGGGG